MRGDQLVRQWELLRLLLAHQGGVRVEDMAKALKTRPRNVYRDIEVLKRAGFNVCKARRDGTPYYYIPSDELVLKETTIYPVVAPTYTRGTRH